MRIIVSAEFGVSVRASKTFSFSGCGIVVDFINCLNSSSESFLNIVFGIFILGRSTSVKASRVFPLFDFLIELMITLLRTFSCFSSFVDIDCSASVRAISAFSFFVKLGSPLF